MTMTMNITPLIIEIEQIAICSYSVVGFADFITSNGQAIWITNPSKNVVQCFNSHSEYPLYEVVVPQAVGIPVFAFCAVWVASLTEQSIYKIDPETGAVLAIIPTGLGDHTGEFSLAASPEGIWIISAESELSLIDPRCNQVVKKIEVSPKSYNLCYGDGALWLSNQKLNSIQRIDPHNLTPYSQILVGRNPVFLAFGCGAIWTLNQTDGTVSKIDPRLNRVVDTIILPDETKGDGGDIHISHGKIWVRTTQVLLIQIDCHTLAIEKIYQHRITSGSGAVCSQGSLVWISAHDIEKLWAISIS